MRGERDLALSWSLTEPQLREWIGELLGSGIRVIAPVEEDGLSRYRPLRRGQELSLSGRVPSWSPKEFLFPKTETLFRYELGGAEPRLEEVREDPPRQVLFGLPPCDAAGLARLDAVLGVDPSYAVRRRATTIVAIACEAARPECFCTAVGGSPAGEEGSDVLLARSGRAFLLRPLTPRGAELVGGESARWDRASESSWKEVGRRLDAVARDIGRSLSGVGVAERLASSFESAVWKDFGRRCLGCSVCTFLCPSCSCFDIQDEGTSGCGRRCRIWDSCTSALFTLHASGHNPRPDQAARYRQRVLHKFSVYPLEHGGVSMCVGCGRCVRACPAGLDVRETVERVLARGGEGEHGRA